MEVMELDIVTHLGIMTNSVIYPIKKSNINSKFQSFQIIKIRYFTLLDIIIIRTLKACHK